VAEGALQKPPLQMALRQSEALWQPASMSPRSTHFAPPSGPSMQLSFPVQAFLHG
jgi:hypothetical protein